MDPSFQTCTCLAFLSNEFCACSLIFVAFMVLNDSCILISILRNLNTTNIYPQSPINGVWYGED